MSTRRVKLVWGASRVIRGRWFLGLFGFYERFRGVPRSGLAISVRGALLWAAALLVVMYIAGASALFAVWQRNPYSQLTYADALLYPLRRAEISEKKGRAFLAQGSALFQAQKYGDAANLLRLGLARYPHDLAGRLQLAQFYMLANQRILAVDVLQAGLREEYPGRAYLEALCHAAEQGEDHGAVIDLATRYAPRLPSEAGARDRRWLEGKQVGALLAAGRAEEALAFAQTLPPGDTASEYRVVALLALRRAPEALGLLDEWQHRSGAARGMMLRLRARIFRELGRLEDMDSTLGELRAMAPAEPAALVYGVIQRAMAGQTEAAAAALDDYLFRFGGDVANLLLLAEPLAEIQQLPALQRCAAAAAERGYPNNRFDMLLVQVNVDQGRWAEAAALLRELPLATGREAGANRVWREWVQRLIEAANSPAEPAQLALVEFLRSRPWPVRMFRKSIAGLLLAGRLETARDVVAVARRGFPQHAWLEQTEAEIRRHLAASQPGPTPAAGPQRIRLEPAFFERLDEVVRERNWAEADAMIRDLRAVQPPPAWAGARDAELRLVQVRSAQARADAPGMLMAARLYLGGSQVHAQRLLEVAREFSGAGDPASAVRLTREVLRRFPALSSAQRQLAEWEPPVPAEGAAK